MHGLSYQKNRLSVDHTYRRSVAGATLFFVRPRGRLSLIEVMKEPPSPRSRVADRADHEKQTALPTSTCNHRAKNAVKQGRYRLPTLHNPLQLKGDEHAEWFIVLQRWLLLSFPFILPAKNRYAIHQLNLSSPPTRSFASYSNDRSVTLSQTSRSNGRSPPPRYK